MPRPLHPYTQYPHSQHPSRTVCQLAAGPECHIGGGCGSGGGGSPAAADAEAAMEY